MKRRVRDISAENHGFFIYGLGHYAFSASTNPARPISGTTSRISPSGSRPPEGRTAGLHRHARSRFARLLKHSRNRASTRSCSCRRRAAFRTRCCARSIELFGREVLPEVKQRDQRGPRKSGAKQPDYRQSDGAQAQLRSAEAGSDGGARGGTSLKLTASGPDHVSFDAESSDEELFEQIAERTGRCANAGAEESPDAAEYNAFRLA